ncbi:LacI family DNA-binding transcriptional regulator [Neobacillus sp. MM2021_6]|uniref:LacI family DNA-binding transcriptional regulator n=1 Tax=Bacillaceae TaxID=186817 RepID=UPI001A946029|nr:MULTISPECIES: LacI family DNA-binding transcriptional regulator [Bacillaceae]MBO0959908.1 LacI family DNA-binding transcriptional regulator [Neobacillus sp. MM2021_6]
MKKRRKITMKDISDKLGISINAVSLALNNKYGVSEETRNDVLRMADELGYFSDTQPKSVQVNNENICLLLNNRYLRNPSFYSKVVFGIEEEAKQGPEPLDLIVNFFNDDQLQIPSCIEQNKVVGILIVGKIKDAFLEELSAFGIPIVLVDHFSHTHAMDAILTQNAAGAYLATQHVINRGHYAIGYVGDIDFSLSFKERWFGFYTCAREMGICDDLHLSHLFKYSITKNIAHAVMDKDYQFLANTIKRLEEFPTAWVCCNDETAAAMYHALELLGIKVPEQVSLVGFDDTEIYNILEMGLTTIHVMKETMGKTALQTLIERIKKPTNVSKTISLPVTLAERGSVRNMNTSQE